MTRIEARPWMASVLIEVSLFVLAAGVFSLAVLGYDALAGRSGRPPWWVLALAALVVAVLLREARPALARRTRRLVLGEQAASSYETVTDFISRMTTTLDVDEVLPRLAEAAARSVHSERGEVSVRLDDGHRWRRVWPEPVGEQDQWESAGALTVPVQHGGSVVGEIGVSGIGDGSGDDDGMDPGDRDVLGELAAPAGVALATVRLTFELRERARQLAELASELQACQARMVVARSDERRRLLARVETAVAPRLDETDAALRSLEETANPSGAARSLEDARDAAMASLEAVRAVARGIFPNLLADAGVAAALRSWGEERVPPVGVSLAGEMSRLRSMPAVEAALYFACVSALAGTAADEPGTGDARTERRSEVAGPADAATGPAVELEVAGPADAATGPAVEREVAEGADARARPTGELEVAESTDAGAGSRVEMSVPLPVATVEPATLLAIRDRIGALGGTVTVDAAPGGGGRMTVLVPLAPEVELLRAAGGVSP